MTIDSHLEEDYENNNGCGVDEIDPLLETEFDSQEPCDEPDDNMSDVEADADTLASAGMGTDEDYGCFEQAETYGWFDSD